MLNRRRIKEGQTLEQLVLLSFSVLESVLLLKDNDVSQKVTFLNFHSLILPTSDNFIVGVLDLPKKSRQE